MTLTILPSALASVSLVSTKLKPSLPQLLEALAALNLKYRLEPEIYGLNASLEYCNDSANEIVHRTELTRSTRKELYQAMRDYVEVITDARQRAVYQEVLRDQIGI